jgi:ATP-dependent phosphofructokinase / diphosphate-dependent phosphofructokinase
VAKIRERNRLGRSFSIVVVAEGALPAGGKMTYREKAEGGYEGRLGGIGEHVAGDIQEYTKQECRALVLGHLQRGGQPTSFDRVLGTRFGSAAVRLALEGQWGRMVALAPPHVVSIPLEKAVSKLKRVPAASDVVRAARDLGITFGEEK